MGALDGARGRERPAGAHRALVLLRGAGRAIESAQQQQSRHNRTTPVTAPFSRQSMAAGAAEAFAGGPVSRSSSFRSTGGRDVIRTVLWNSSGVISEKRFTPWATPP